MTAPFTTDPAAGVDPFAATAPAARVQLASAAITDVAIVVGAAAAGALCIGVGLGALGWAIVAVAVAVAVGSLVALGATGRTPGRLAAGIRTVERSSAAPSGGRILSDLLARRLRSFDLNRGRDPLAPVPADFRFPAPQQVSPPAPSARGGVLRPAIVSLDSGQKLALESALVIGRNPRTTPSTPERVFEWTDLSRTVSNSHVRLEWDGSLAWVTDLGSTNGTVLRTARGDQALLPHQRTPLPATAVLALGDRVLTVAVPS